MASAGGSPSELPRALTEGFQSAFLGGAAFALLGLVLGALLIHGRDSRAYQQQGGAAHEQPAEARA
jgi:hypothetical protein